MTAKVVGVLVLLSLAVTPSVRSARAEAGPARRFVVLYADGASANEAHAALAALGATILHENTAIGLATVAVADPSFVADAMATGAFYGIAPNRSIGTTTRRDRDAPGRHATSGGPQRLPHVAAARGADPLFKYEWGMRMVHASPKGSYSTDRGDRRVLVGIMDSGIDLSGPDLRRHVDRKLSKSFLGDLPPGRDPCDRHPHSRYCGNSPFKDPVGHGTAVASLVGGKINGFGMSGVAPNVSLVSLRTGREFVFLQPVVDALTYAGTHGIDVVNMSFFVDPWLFNCPDNPADSNRQQMEQRTIVKAVQDAVDYARAHSVTLITAIGNEAIDLGHPTIDDISPDYPPGKSYRRDVDNSCLVVPQETDGVIGVSGLGPSERKAYYSDYGAERTDVSAPGGDDLDKSKRAPLNEILTATSRLGLAHDGLIRKNGEPRSRSVLRRCRRGGRQCEYLRFWQGTSFASPIAAGVAALIVGSNGRDDGAGGISMDPADVEAKLLSSATHHACPKGRVQRYPGLGRKYRARCEHRSGGGNGLYGAGIVDARRALKP